VSLVAGKLRIVDALACGSIFMSVPFSCSSPLGRKCQILTGFDSPVVPSIKVTVKVAAESTTGFRFEVAIVSVVMSRASI
jgi:hypothetical protein